MADSSPASIAFSTQSVHYDADDKTNPVIADLRQQVYNHIKKHLSPQSNVLELNAGTGIDATWFVGEGHRILATDISDGMISAINSKIAMGNYAGRLRALQLSYDQIDQLRSEKFDFIFSNFGGLNCISDLSLVTKHLHHILNPGGHVCFVIMPPICPWELLSALKGNRSAFRRLAKNGVMAHIEGQYFPTYYHSISAIKESFGSKFKLIASEGLAAISPPPHRRDFPTRHPGIYSLLRKSDAAVNTYFPFNRWADHVIMTFRYEK
jgi:ubiquinone/menaquinone biosynthesis C-methylase UbiE